MSSPALAKTLALAVPPLRRRSGCDVRTHTQEAYGPAPPDRQGPADPPTDFQQILELLIEFLRLALQKLMDVRARRPATLADRDDVPDRGQGT